MTKLSFKLFINKNWGMYHIVTLELYVCILLTKCWNKIKNHWARLKLDYTLVFLLTYLSIHVGVNCLKGVVYMHFLAAFLLLSGPAHLFQSIILCCIILLKIYYMKL